MADQGGLREFAAVIEHGSFTAAADALNVSTSFVSREVKRLEDRLTTFLELRVLLQQIANLRDLHLVQCPGRFFAIACEERHGRALRQQFRRATDLTGSNPQLGRDLLDGISSLQFSSALCDWREPGDSGYRVLNTRLA